MEAYEQIRIVGRGASGVCWLCRHRGQKGYQKVIVKLINIHGLSDSEENSIKGEVKLLQKVQHPMIIGYYDSFSFENQLAIVMQYAEGGTLYSMIQDQKCRNEKFPEKQVLEYFTQILIALHHMHSKQIVHRDLKPQNILMNRKKTLVKLSDFGVSKELSTRSVAETVIGTASYLSPEICEGRAYNQKSDMWSLGCVLYELLELKLAFDGENLPAIIMKIAKAQYAPVGSHVSPEVKCLVEELLQLNERKRPDVNELLVQPTVLYYTIAMHVDLGRLDNTNNDKRKPTVSSRLGTTPSTLTKRALSPLATTTTASTSVAKSPSTANAKRTSLLFNTHSSSSTSSVANRVRVIPTVNVDRAG